MYDCVIIGSGFAGAVIAQRLAEKGRKKVLILEKRNHIGGNSYDKYDEHGVLIHQYGPHIFHTNEERVFEYLSNFTDWSNYRHEVLADIFGKYLPIPFNLNTLELVYGEKEAERLKGKLLQVYGRESRVPIRELQNYEDKDIQKIAEYVYENIFLRYTMKQWGKTPEEIDPEVTARVPVLISEDNRYFQDKYQGMPLLGYTELFKKMLLHDNIEIRFETDAKDLIHLEEGRIMLEGKPYNGNVVYTGAIDELFDCKYGRLPYRSLDFVFEHYEQDSYQPAAVVNYTVNEEFTRITEFKKLTGQRIKGTTIVKEYPKEYRDVKTEIPYYSINNDENNALYDRYAQLTKKCKSFYLLGRMAEYKYYNIDSIVGRALELSDRLISC